METTEQNNQPSHRRLLIGLGAAVGLILLILLITVLAVIVLFFKGDEPKKAVTTDPKVVTKQTVEQNLSDAATSIQQAKVDQTSAKAALDDEQNRVKLSN